MAPGRFGISLNLRHSGDIQGNVRELLNNPSANVVSFLLRRILETEESYAGALKRLVTEPLISESYIIVSGVASGEGAVITRNRTIAADVWTLGGPQKNWYIRSRTTHLGSTLRCGTRSHHACLSPPSRFLLQTNHDHWLPSPPGDHRSCVATHTHTHVTHT